MSLLSARPRSALSLLGELAPQRDERRRLGVLVAICVFGAMAEAGAAALAGGHGVLALASETTALAPVVAVHDDRLILVFADHWWVVVLELCAALLVRSAQLTVFARLAWPGAPPALGLTLRRSVVAEAVLLVAFSPWATLSFLGGVVSLAWLVIAGLAGCLAIGVLVMAHAGIAPWWWARRPPLGAMMWSLASFVAASCSAAGVTATRSASGVAIAGVAGAANAWCWRGVVRACARAPVRRPRPLARLIGPTAIALSVPLLLVAGVSGFGPYIETAVPHRVFTVPPPPHGRRVVLLVAGFMSDWSGGRPALRVPGFYTTEFSYRGQAPNGRPLPYASGATMNSLPVLVRRLSSQVDRLARRSGRPVDVVAVSEGTFVVWQYLATHPHPPLAGVVLASPLPAPDRVTYPPPGRSGPGLLAGMETRALVALLDAEVAKAHLSADMAMVRSLMDDAAVYRERWLCPVSQVRTVALVPLTAAVADPPGQTIETTARVEPAVHAGVLRHPGVMRLVQRLLAQGRLPGSDAWSAVFTALRDAASAWEVPPLPLAAMPHGGGDPPLAGAVARCR